MALACSQSPFQVLSEAAKRRRSAAPRIQDPLEAAECRLRCPPPLNCMGTQTRVLPLCAPLLVIARTHDTRVERLLLASF